MQKTKKSRAYILPITLLLASAFALSFVMALVPTAGAVSSCAVTWSMPSGTYAPSATVQGTVTEACTGSGSWNLYSEPGGILVASGSFSCPCSAKVLFSYTAGSAPITKGAYQVAAYVNGANWLFGFTVEDFIVTNVLPFGTIAAAGVSLVGLLAVRRLSRTFSISTPRV